MVACGGEGTLGVISDPRIPTRAPGEMCPCIEMKRNGMGKGL